jgi:DNA-binding NtrC family response regulator
MSAPSERCDVLVVDDEEVVRSGVTRILEAGGFRVSTADSAKAAIAHPQLGHFQLVLCDLMLPDQPGTNVLAAMRARGLATPVVVITGYATSDSLDEALAAGAAAVLTKPFDEEELLAVVADALGKAGGDRR